ncbi:MAG: hypothetical protein ACRD2U_17445 [Terriglobales bacterium]
MPRIPIFRIGPTAEELEPPRLASYVPSLPLQDLRIGIDNLRHDVFLSPHFVENARLQIARLIVHYGNVKNLLAAETPEDPETPRNNPFIGVRTAPRLRPKAEPSALKPLLIEIHLAALNRAKAGENIWLDVLARVAIIKFLRAELNVQFAQTLERCRGTLSSYEGVRQQKAVEYREQVAAFQVGKKAILRQTGQELFRTLREIEKETIARTRRSLFGNQTYAEYRLFLTPLLFSEDAHDIYLNAEHYVMIGNFDRDPDRFWNSRRMACDFLQVVGLGPEAGEDAVLETWLNVPENAEVLVGSGIPDDATPEGASQRVRLMAWRELLEREQAMDHVVASYEVVPLLNEYSPTINAQQLKNALISKEERNRVEKLIVEHGKFSGGSLSAAVSRVANCRGDEQAKIAGRFLRDFFRHHRDVRRLEVLNEALNQVNIISSEKMRDLSAMNGTLYEYLLPHEQKPTEDRVLRHVVVKADVRDSSLLTKSLMARKMNPASYFSLNFYEPVNKLLNKYGATKVFLEGDAIILALLEREMDPELGVSKACVLAREMIEIVRGYNQLLERAGLPTLELGLGISYQNSAPVYLADGMQQIMISDALNESDRLSSCDKRIRKAMQTVKVPFNVYAFQTAGEREEGDNPDDYVLKYNLGGIRLSEAAFKKLGREISLEPVAATFPRLWNVEEIRLHSGMVPLGGGIFRKIVIRSSRIPIIDPRSFTLKSWTDAWCYEVCSNPAVYAEIDGKAAAGK